MIIHLIKVYLDSRFSITIRPNIRIKITRIMIGNIAMATVLK